MTQFGQILCAANVWAYFCSVTSGWTQGFVDESLLDLVNFDFPQANIDEGQSIEENWVNEAVLNVAYYLRSHKYNEYDRRLKQKANETQNFFAKVCTR